MGEADGRARSGRSVFFPVLLLVLATLALDLLFGTAAAWLRARREAGSAPAAVGGTMMYRRLSPYHHDLVANLDQEARWGGIRYPMRTNALGFKSSAVGPLAPKGKRKRLLFLGDSVTEGVGVGPEAVFAARVGAQLSDTETLNAGVSSYSPIIYYRKLRYLLEEARLEVDAVAVFLDLSDIQDEAVYYRWGPQGEVVDGEGRAEYAAAGINPLTKSWKWDWSRRVEGFWERQTLIGRRLIRWRRNRWGYPQALLESTGFFRVLWTLDEKVRESYGRIGLARATQNMDLLADYLRKRRIPLVLAVYPWPDQILSRDADSVQVRHWREWCEGQGVDFLDLFPVFLDVKDPWELAGLFIPGDVHWSEAGHDKVARAFSERWGRRAGLH